MLHQSAVPLNLWQTLLELQLPLADTGFALAGGTSLALRLGHRLSIDLDFFTTEPFEPEELAAKLKIEHQSITGVAKGTLQVLFNDLKIEFLKHSYTKLSDVETIDGVKIWSLADVAAMKINAIVNRGSKKDFYDLAALLDIFPMPTILDSYRSKYQPASIFMAIRSMSWFDDADSEPDPISLCEQTWDAVKQRISEAIQQIM